MRLRRGKKGEQAHQLADRRLLVQRDDQLLDARPPLAPEKAIERGAHRAADLVEGHRVEGVPLLQAVADHWEENHEVPAPPADPEDVALHAERDFSALEKHAALTRALNEAKLMHAYRAHRLKARGTATRRALAAVTDRLDPEDVDRAVRMILHLDSSLTWKAPTEEGLTTREATKAVVWAIRALVEELRRTSRQRAATRARRSSPVGATRRPRPR